MSAELRIQELGLELPPAPPKGGVYKPCVVDNNRAYLSGHGPYQNDGTYMTGRLGEDLTLEEGQQAARQVGLALLATIKAELGSLDRVKRVIKTLALVICTLRPLEQPCVVEHLGRHSILRRVWPKIKIADQDHVLLTLYLVEDGLLLHDRTTVAQVRDKDIECAFTNLDSCLYGRRLLSNTVHVECCGIMDRGFGKQSDAKRTRHCLWTVIGNHAELVRKVADDVRISTGNAIRIRFLQADDVRVELLQ